MLKNIKTQNNTFSRYFYFPKEKIEGNVIIRPIKNKKELIDLEWEGKYIHFRRMYREIFERVEDGLAYIWIAELSQKAVYEKKRVIGQGFVQFDNEYRPDLADGFVRAYFHGFRIRPQYRSAGVGTFLMEVVETDLRNKNFKILFLAVAKENIKALNLYKKLGYNVVGSEKGEWSYIDHNGYMQKVHEPSWRMAKNLY